MQRFASIVLVDRRGWLLLQERDEHPVIDPECWGFVGGHVDDGEDADDAAYRELEEETGLRARPGRIIGCWSAHLRSFANGDRIQGIPTLLEAELVGGELRRDPTGEIDAAGWYTADDLPPLEHPWSGRVRLVLTGEGEPLD